MTGNVLGLDLGLAHAGAAHYHHDGRYDSWRISTEPQPGAPVAVVAARIRRVARWALDQVHTDTVLVVVEGPSYASLHGQSHERAAVWWRVVDNITRAGIPLAVLSPKTVKKRITGDGNADKRAMRTALARHLPGNGIGAASYDEADAGGLALCGACWLHWPNMPDLDGRRALPWPRNTPWPDRATV